jgi:hypothetical protein
MSAAPAPIGDDSKKGNSRSPSGMTTRKATAVFPGEANVNSGGLTTFLWIKRFFGVCGELW